MKMATSLPGTTARPGRPDAISVIKCGHTELVVKSQVLRHTVISGPTSFLVSLQPVTDPYRLVWGVRSIPGIPARLRWTGGDCRLCGRLSYYEFQLVLKIELLTERSVLCLKYMKVLT